MTEPAVPRRALVLGGSGAVGGAVVEALARRGVEVVFTFHDGRERALALSRAHGARAIAVDLARPDAARGLVRALEAEGQGPDILVHAAGITRGRKLGEAPSSGRGRPARADATTARLSWSKTLPTARRSSTGSRPSMSSWHSSPARPRS